MFDTKNKESFKSFLIDNFAKRKSLKKNKFYKTLCRYYNKYPDTVTEVIKYLPVLGYWKDYLLLLKFCQKGLQRPSVLADKNEKLTSYIYNLLVEQFKSDFKNKNGTNNTNQISTLAKWLPRQNSYFDKQVDFINTFNKIMYPNYTKIRARVCYRKQVAQLCRILCVPEQYICNKQYDQIDLSKTTDKFITKNHEILLKNIPDKLQLHVLNKFKEMPFWKFVKACINRTYDDFYKNIIQEVWDIRKIDFIPEMNGYINLRNINIILADISESVFSNHMYIIVGVLLLASECMDKKIYTNSCNPTELENFNNHKTVFERIAIIYANVRSSDQLMYEKIPNCDNTKLLILTDKNEVIVKNIIYWQLDKNILIRNDRTAMTPILIKKTQPSTIINNIIANSKELKQYSYQEFLDKYYIRIYIFALCVFCLFLFYFK